MNAELAAMNKISKAVETATEGLEPGARERVLQWFVDWAQSQVENVHHERLTKSVSPTNTADTKGPTA